MTECEGIVSTERMPLRFSKRLPGRLDTCEYWPLYGRALAALADAGIPYAVGGAFALGVYTNHFRDTKDLDLYVTPADRDRAIQALLGIGLTDIYEHAPYDRNWIFRSAWDDIVVDVIWRFANYVADVDDAWVRVGPQTQIGEHTVQVIPAEELLWAKLYIVQRHRCDWTDLLNLLYCAAGEMNWSRLLARIGEDRLLFAGLLSVFTWLCPGRAEQIPSWVWGAVGMEMPNVVDGALDVDPERATLLDSRPWFFAMMS